VKVQDSKIVLSNPSTVHLDNLGIKRYKNVNTFGFDYIFDQAAT
jgi:hypothetical protein